MTDYAVNIRSIVASFYIGTGGLDVGLIQSCQGIPGGENWKKSFTWHLKKVCKSIINVVDQIIAETLMEKVALTIKDKLAKNILIVR